MLWPYCQGLFWEVSWGTSDIALGQTPACRIVIWYPLVSIVPPVLTFLTTMCVSSEVVSMLKIVHVSLSCIYCQDMGCG